MKPVGVTIAAPYATFDRDIGRLMRHCPLSGKVRVVVKPLGARFCGFCHTLKDGSIRLEIATGLEKTTARDTLIHEWAHAVVARSHARNHKDHGPEWGLAYAQCYRAVVENRL